MSWVRICRDFQEQWTAMQDGEAGWGTGILFPPENSKSGLKRCSGPCFSPSSTSTQHHLFLCPPRSLFTSSVPCWPSGCWLSPISIDVLFTKTASPGSSFFVEMARYCGEVLTIDSLSSPSGYMEYSKTEDFRPNISFVYNADKVETVSTIDFDTFSVSIVESEVQEEKGFYRRACAAILKKLAGFASYVLCFHLFTWCSGST
ncbi:unnamed protein product [Cyclocybe aegerita]|uniref:Uncharacterized protein n=1 Tax=Cyclocybe aegerita TaxID=1973307 RepID=A0A8S0WLR0_CYCAE|nr:unnamed protein product [Cyclocybe aegerita]